MKIRKTKIKAIKLAVNKLLSKIERIENKLENFPEQIFTINIDKFTDRILEGNVISHYEKNNNVKPLVNWKSLNNVLKEPKIKDGVIYIIFVDNITSWKKIKNKFKEEKNKQNMSRIIEEHWKKISKKAQCLYVGSSHKINTRIKQHLGVDIKKDKRTTYALYMDSWLSNYVNKNRNSKLSITIYSFDLFNNVNHIPNSLQLLEDLMWEAYKPLFGKQGAK